MAKGVQDLTPEMIAGFQQGAGFSIAALSLFIVSVAATLYLLWGGWTLVGLFRWWAAGHGAVARLVWRIGAVLMLLLILLYYF